MPQAITVVMEHPEWGTAYIYEVWHQSKADGTWVLLPVAAEFTLFCPKAEQDRCIAGLVEARCRQLGCEVDWIEFTTPATAEGLPVPTQGHLRLGAKIAVDDKIYGATEFVVRGSGWRGRETGSPPPGGATT